MKRLAMLGGAALVAGVLFQTSYVACEFILVLAALSLVYSVFLLFLALCYLAFRGAAWMYPWLRLHSHPWDRASGAWVVGISLPQLAPAKSTQPIK